MQRVLLLLYVCLLCCNLIPAQDQATATAKAQTAAAVNEVRSDGAEPAAKLPVRRVVLYKNGVGYFEHLGRVHGNQDVAIPFTSGQLNDVLKTLTVLDLNDGRIAGVAYGTAAPLDRQLGDLRLPSSEKTTLAEFLGALR